ncbi:MAG TPA: hypothetical protein VI603_08530 [Saprospiraceae bacterium]|nr:hypothetical protein [Saprospiraceae bacterium]
MKYPYFIIAMSLIFLTSCSTDNPLSDGQKNTRLSCSSLCKAKSNAEVTCKLSSQELRARKETVLASLKKQVLEKQATGNGYAFKFPGTDAMVDELVEFIKTERSCCDFFVFNLSVSGDKSEAWLELTGVEGAKEFIDTEMEL